MNSSIGAFEDATQIRGSFLKSLRQPDRKILEKYCWFNNDNINLIKDTVEGN